MAKDNKQERTEYITMYVTPEVKKELDQASTNDKLKEDIIRGFLKGEKDWLRDELRQIDNATIEYSSRLIGIKDAFDKVSKVHIEEIDKLNEKVYSSLSKPSNLVDGILTKVKFLKEDITYVNDNINSLNLDRLERCLDLVDRINSLGKEDISLFKKLIDKE